MSTVYLSEVKSASKLDSYSGLRLDVDEDETDGLGATKSTPLLLETYGPTKNPERPLSPLLNHVLRPSKVPKSPEGRTSSLTELEDGKTSSFTDILESRDTDMDQAWMEMQVRAASRSDS